MKSNYDKFPTTKIIGYDDQAFQGYDAIINELKQQLQGERHILVADVYPGVYDDEILPALCRLQPKLVINMDALFKEAYELTTQMQYHLTDDRVFGKMYYGDVIDFIDLEKLEKAKQAVADCDGLILIYGFGASLVHPGDTLVYFDMARWEIQKRYRNGMGNYKCDNYKEDTLRKNKRGFFIEWRIADKHKETLFERMDYVVDTNVEKDPKMISGAAFRHALKVIVRRPFRLVPYFDPGVWGGQWMKEVCDLDRSKANFAWSFDGVPEENSLYFDFHGIRIELPAMDLTLYQPKAFLGSEVYSRFGAEFPIRFDFLDTMGGQNLSLQVHPISEYMKKQFGMPYTQDESYYILDAKEDACVYLGLKEGIDKEKMMADLRSANCGECGFDADAYINQFRAKKHDHFLIPAGTCHCSGKNAMVLEISATPYIFTFKLWDWGRLGLDGKPRPVHLDHGEKVIQWDRNTAWVKEHLVNAVYTLYEDEDVTEEHTGLHELELIETRRYFIRGVSHHQNDDNVCMCNLVEGREAIIESEDGLFEPFIIHYAETFILPASCGNYTICPYGEAAGQTIVVMKAYVRKMIQS